MLDTSPAAAGRTIRLAIILGAPPSAQNLDRVGVRELARDFEVKVLDCTRVVDRISPEHDGDKAIIVESVASIDEFRMWMARERPDYVIDFIGWTPQSSAIYRILRKLNIKIVVQSLGAKPSVEGLGTARRGLRLLVRDPARLARGVVSRVTRWRMAHGAAPDVAVLAGIRSATAENRRASTIIWTGSRDYYDYRRTTNAALTRPSASRYIVFLDEAIVNASDYKLLRLDQPTRAANYYPLLVHCLNRVETISGLKVVVAAHPNGKSDPNYFGYFGDREVRFDSTATLCAASRLVLLHASTAGSYAVLNSRPTVVLTSAELDRSWQGDAIRSMASELNCPILFMEADAEAYRRAILGGGNPDPEAYERYRRNYIVTDDALESEPWESFIDFAKGIPVAG